MIIAFAILKNDSHITIAKMTEIVGTSGRIVQRYLQELQNAGILKWKGGDINRE